jgi:hypothetical protein
MKRKKVPKQGSNKRTRQKTLSSQAQSVPHPFGADILPVSSFHSSTPKILMATMNSNRPIVSVEKIPGSTTDQKINAVFIAADFLINLINKNEEIISQFIEYTHQIMQTCVLSPSLLAPLLEMYAKVLLSNQETAKLWDKIKLLQSSLQSLPPDMSPDGSRLVPADLKAKSISISALELEYKKSHNLLFSSAPPAFIADEKKVSSSPAATGNDAILEKNLGNEAARHSFGK